MDVLDIIWKRDPTTKTRLQIAKQIRGLLTTKNEEKKPTTVL